MVDPRAWVAAFLLLGVSLTGCIGFDGPLGDCSAQHAFADRLVFEQANLYEALGDAQEQANRSPEATSAHQPQGVWSGARGEIETVRLDGRVHGSYVATPTEDASFRVQDSALTGHGPLWLDEVEWLPGASEDERIGYQAPANPSDPHTFSMTFRTSNISETEAADHVRSLHTMMFPEHPFEPLDDEKFPRAWMSSYEIHPDGPVRADALLAHLLDAGELRIRQAPFEDPVFPHTLGTVFLQGEDIDPYEGEIRLRLGHDLRAIGVGTQNPIALEVTPDDRAYVSHLGSAALGEDELRELAHDRLASIDALASLAIENASYEEGGKTTVQAETNCTQMDALGAPLSTDAKP